MLTLRSPWFSSWSRKRKVTLAMTNECRWLRSFVARCAEEAGYHLWTALAHRVLPRPAPDWRPVSAGRGAPSTARCNMTTRRVLLDGESFRVRTTPPFFEKTWGLVSSGLYSFPVHSDVPATSVADSDDGMQSHHDSTCRPAGLSLPHV